MLNKKLCQRCFQEQLPSHLEKWNERDEIRWEQSVVMCPANVRAYRPFLFPINEVPSHCPYILEHTVSPELRPDYFSYNTYPIYL